MKETISNSSAGIINIISSKYLNGSVKKLDGIMAQMERMDMMFGAVTLTNYSINFITLNGKLSVKKAIRRK